MRDLKFRAWDDKAKVFIVPEKLGAWPYRDSSAKEFYIEAEDTEGLPTLPIELLQFTGLKDKNGKEIYEGDIATDEYGNFYEIRFDEDAGAFQRVNRKSKTINPMRGSTAEVIGNIYETPELLSV